MRVRRLTIGVVAATITALALAACGGNGDNGGEDAGGATAAATSAATEATTVSVTETEFKIDMPETSLAPGTYTFVVENAGQIDHALEVEGSGSRGGDRHHRAGVFRGVDDHAGGRHVRGLLPDRESPRPGHGARATVG